MVIGVIALLASSLAGVIISQYDIWNLNVNQSKVTEHNELIISYLESDINRAVAYEVENNQLQIKVDLDRDGKVDQENKKYQDKDEDKYSEIIYYLNENNELYREKEYSSKKARQISNLVKNINFKRINNSQLLVDIDLKSGDFKRSITKSFNVFRNQSKYGDYYLQFNGEDDYIKMAESFYSGSGYSELTLIAEVKTYDSNADIYSFEDNGYFNLALNSGQVVFKTHNGSSIRGNQNIDDGLPYLIAVVFRQGTAKLYIDDLTDEKSIELDNQSSSFSNTFGEEGNTSSFIGKSFAGDLYWLQHWNRALTKTELELYTNNQLSGAENGLISYYPIANNDEYIYDFANDYDGEIFGAKYQLIGSNQ